MPTPTPTQYKFTYQELAEMMVQKVGVDKGLWGISFNFGLAATNIGEDATQLKPAAVVAIIEVGLQEFDKPTNLTVDAAAIGHGSSSIPRRSRPIKK